MCLRRIKVLDRGTLSSAGKVYNQDVMVPCGKCSECRKRKQNDWSFRLREQEKISKISYFVTLTYDTLHVPISNKGFMSLRKSDLQKYFKLLRKYEDQYRDQMGQVKEKIKYYAVGEYGTLNKRPHYHAIIFNAQEYNIVKAWQEFRGKETYGVRGDVHCGKVECGSINYTLKYVSKNIEDVPLWKDIEPPFAIMSKHLGENYIKESTKKFHVINNYTDLDGYKIALPAYYRKKMLTEEQQAVHAHKAQELQVDEEKRFYKKTGRTLQEAQYDRFYQEERVKKQKNLSRIKI